MFDVAGHRGSVGSSGEGLPLRSILFRVAPAAALLAVLLCGAKAQAATLYRCTGASGEAVFSSDTTGYQGCKKISGYDVPTAVRNQPSPALRASLGRVAGSVMTGARNLAADGAEPTSLARVGGAAQTSARALDLTLVQRMSFAGVRASVATNAPSPALVADAVPGKWSYSDSLVAPAVTAAAGTGPAAASPGAKVLRGAVYRIVQADGSVEYTNLRPAGKKGHAVTLLFSYIATCAACDPRSPIRWGSVALNLTAYADTIRAASAEYGVDEAFLRAIIHAESAFNPRALSIKGAQGLMQLMPGTASDMGVLDAFDTDQNIRGGARYLSLMLRNFGGDERLAAAAYNAGPGAVKRYSGVPPYAETQVYVERVATLRQRYGTAIHPPLAVNTPVDSAPRM